MGGSGKRGDRQCTAKSTTTGERCERAPIKGGTVCTTHGGKSPIVAAHAKVRAEVLAWGLGDVCADPGEVLLRLVTQSAARAQRYAQLLEDAYEAAERLRLAHDAELLVEVDDRVDGDGPERAAAQTAREDLRRIFGMGGVAALVGQQYSSTKDGDVFGTGEAIRGLARLEAEERDRCAGFAAKAIAAGLAERQVRLAERQGAALVAIIRAVLGDLGVAEDPRVPGIVATRIREITGSAA